MLSPELIRKIKFLHLKTNYLANEIFSGEYKSSFRGQGMEFEEVREYQPGDDIRAIDWNVTARTGKPHMKVFKEERELTMMLLVDASASGNFGTGERLKRETSAEVAAVLAYAAIKSNDKVGLMIFTDRIEHFIPPQKGRSHVYHVIKEILTFKPQHLGTDIAVPLETVTKLLSRRAICFVISDFQGKSYQKALAVAKRRHDVICTLLYDDLELELPHVGLTTFRDPETLEEVIVDTSDKKTRKRFKHLADSEMKEREKMFKSAGVDFLLINQNEDYIDPLLKFFRLREKRL